MNRPKRRSKIGLWFEYNQTYLNIQRMPPHIRAKFENDPGYKFMKRGWAIFWVVILLFGTLGIMHKRYGG